MKSQRPYLVRAYYDWIVDSDEVPYVLVDATQDGVVVPEEYVEDGRIVLNLGPNAVRDLNISDDFLMCSSRFNGRAFELILPIQAISAIYAKDTGEGAVFESVQEPPPPTDPKPPSPPEGETKPRLKSV